MDNILGRGNSICKAVSSEGLRCSLGLNVGSCREVMTDKTEELGD